MGYLPHDHRQYEFAPVHLKFDGDTAFDPVVSIGLKYDGGYYAWTHGSSCSEIQIVPEKVEVSVSDSEAEMLAEFAEFVESELDNSRTVLVGYKEETWREGGFNKLRTRCVRTDCDWPLSGMYYTDFGEAITEKGRFNTNVPSMSGANVAPLNDFIDFHELDIDKSLNRDPKREAVEEAGYTVEQVREFADATGHEVPYDSLDGLQDVYELFVEDSLVEAVESNNTVEDGDSTANIEQLIADLVRIEKLFSLADEFTSRNDWHTKQL